MINSRNWPAVSVPDTTAVATALERVLKMDVEGAEYKIIDGLRDATHPPKQLLIEFHHRFNGIGNKRTVASIELLAEIGYKIFDVSETGREVGFILSEKPEDPGASK